MEIIDVNVQWGFYPLAMIDASPQRVSNLLKEAGISKGLAISFKSSLLSYKEGNRETLHISQQNPLFLPVFAVDPRDYPRCMKEIEEAKEKGFFALRLFRKHSENGMVLKEIFRFAAKLSLPILCDFVPPVLDITPLPPIVLLEIPMEELGEAFLLLERDEVYIEFSPLLIGSGRLSDNLKGKLLFGSRLPFLPPSLNLKLIEEEFHSPQDRELILSLNAKKIFSLS
jgi:predicted TIM-barrel fold metal-dependent hydrolase